MILFYIIYKNNSNSKNNSKKQKQKMESNNKQFEFIQCEFTRNALKDAHQAITRCELWEWLASYEPEPNKGFMYSTPTPEMTRINSAIYETPSGSSHSGASYGMIMRAMHYIAKNGYDAYKTLCANS